MQERLRFLLAVLGLLIFGVEEASQWKIVAVSCVFWGGCEHHFMLSLFGAFGVFDVCELEGCSAGWPFQ